MKTLAREAKTDRGSNAIKADGWTPSGKHYVIINSKRRLQMRCKITKAIKAGKPVPISDEAVLIRRDIWEQLAEYRKLGTPNEIREKIKGVK